MQKTLEEITAIVEGTLLGEGTISITGITNIEEAGANDITFAVAPHIEKAAASKAAAVILPRQVQGFSKPAILVENPRLAFTKLLEIFTPPIKVNREVHSTAVIGEQVVIGKNVAIMPYVVIADGASVGDNTVIYPHTYVGEGATIGVDSILYPNVTIREHCQVGSRVIIHSGAVIGSDGFGFVTEGGRHIKVPQVGNVVLEDDVEIGAQVAIDRATTTSTIVGKGTKIDNLVHLAHNVEVGSHCFLVAQTGIAGSTKIGNHCIFAGQSGSAGHINIGDNCVFAARTAVISDVPSNSFYAGFPARPHKEWIKSQAGVHKLPDIMKKVRELEKRLNELEKK